MESLKLQNKRDTHISALSDFKKSVSKDAYLVAQVEYIVLLGSVVNNDHVGGYSDLDILLVLKSDKYGNIDPISMDKLRKTAEDLSRKHYLPISLLPHTKIDFEYYVCFEYLCHYTFGKVIYPVHSSDFSKYVRQLLKKRGVSSETRQRYCMYHLRHTRFNTLRKYISLNQYNTSNFSRSFGKTLIDNLIEATEWSLIYFDIWPKTKKEILDKAKEVFGNALDVSILETFMKIRENWKGTKELEILDSLPKGVHYLTELLALMSKEYPYATLEEHIGDKYTCQSFGS